ncbi:MAG: DUF1540 domain-containing protein [Bacillota bacterium]
MPEVKCKVKPCHYWKDGDICSAQSIMVDYNKRSARSTMELGDLDIDIGRAGSRGHNFEGTDRGRENTGMTDFELGDLTGPVGSTDVGHEARTSEETLCSTFKPKDSRHKY